MESLDSNFGTEGSFSITNDMKSYLLEAARWGKFLAILGYIGIGLILIIAVVIMSVGSFAPLMPGVGAGVIAMFYIVIAVLYFFPVYYLHQFSLKMKNGLTSQDGSTVATGFESLKSLFKFMGICAIVILSIYALILVFAVVAGSSF